MVGLPGFGFGGVLKTRFARSSRRWSALSWFLPLGDSDMDATILKDALFQAGLKVHRADCHRQEAETWFSQYLQSDFCRVVIDKDAETGHQLVRAVADKLPTDIVLAIGDTFHNLSSALDYVMTGMMRAANVSTTRVSFPTDESRNALRKSFMPPKPGKGAPPNRRIVENFPALVMVLLTKIKPYRGGNFRLWEIRKADNIDKHNLIIPTVAVTQLHGVYLADEHGNAWQGCSFKLGPGGTLNAIQYGITGDIEIRDKGQPTASITFPQGAEVFAGDPVFPTLMQCVQLVAEAIDLIEAGCTKHFSK
ncbi:hypothetical protein [Mesorhizobium sp. M0633]|uniref:hypothetical protein n=1 Tax=Mesorhizobium sp. M0633 TaxID=2956977 RepID=UPI0033380296